MGIGGDDVIGHLAIEVVGACDEWIAIRSCC